MFNFYLSQNIQVEPLTDRWYAWSHLVPPATAARNLTERYIRILESYIAAPQVHANAVKNPKMIGGPFIDLDGKRVDDVARLLTETRSKKTDLINLSAALKDLDQMLYSEAKGESLEPLYQKVPELLKGYVELVYDRRNSATYRLIEPLIFRSKFFSTDGQSLMLSKITIDGRPFVLSTPRFPSPEVVELELPFANENVDYLFESKNNARPLGELIERCRVGKSDCELFSSFFTLQAPRNYEPYAGSCIRWRYFGHACLLIETAEVTMLFDPVLSYTYESNVSRYTYEDLPEWIDFVVITHNHQDHVLLETLLQIRHKVKNFVVPRNGGGNLEDPSLKLTMERIGFRNVSELSEFQEIDLGDGCLMGLPFFGEHADLNIQSKLAYLVVYKGHKLMFAADSCNLEPELYRHIQRQIGTVDTLFLGMECDGAPLSWLYGPLISQRLERAQNESRRLNGSNFRQAREIIDAMNCRNVFIYAMGQEPWLRHIMSLIYTPESNPIIQSDLLLEMCRKGGITAERLFGEREIVID